VIPDLSVRPSDKNGRAPATDYPPTFTEIDHPRVSAMRFSGTCARALSPGEAPPQSERDYSSDTRLGNRARVSNPIEITARDILVCHQRRRKHPSCARLAARRDEQSGTGSGH
jgi:hypothetical protein